MSCTDPIACYTGTGASNTGQDALGEFVRSVLDALHTAMKGLGTLWAAVPSPEVRGSGSPVGAPTGAAAHALTGGANSLLGYVLWVSLLLCVLSLVVAGARLGWQRRHGDGRLHLGRIGAVLGAVVLLSAASALVSAILPTSSSSTASPTVAFLQNSLWWLVGGLAILSVVVAGARMAWTQRATAGAALVGSLLTLVVVSGAGVTAVGLLTAAGDGFSSWILARSSATDFQTNLGSLLALGGDSPLGTFGELMLGMLAVLFSWLQIGFMVLRSGLLVVMTGALPVAASFTNLEVGRQAFARYCGWLVALVLYKPAAAFVYAAAFQLAGSRVAGGAEGALIQPITGLVLMLVALLALPALMRLAAPAAVAVRGGGLPWTPGGAGGQLGEAATGAVRLAAISRRHHLPGAGDTGIESRQPAPTGSLAAVGRVEATMDDTARPASPGGVR